MSDKDKSESIPAEEPAVETPQARADDTGAGAAEPSATPIEQASDDAVDDAPRDAGPRRGKRAVAWVVVLIAVLAMAALGYWLVSDWQAGRAKRDGDSVSPTAALTEQLDETSAVVAQLQRRIAELEAQNSAAATALADVDTAIDQRLGMLDSLPPRLGALENSVAALQGVSAAARNTWLLAEAEYFMQIANSQLQLAGNPGLAALALGMADERVTQIGDPGLTEVRRALADELAALEAMGRPDIEGATLTLASLARVMDSLPLRNDAAETQAPTETPAEASGLSRAWGSVKKAFSSLVRITPPESGMRPLLAPQAGYFLRTNLMLQLQAARLALLRGEQAVFEQSLDDAANWLNEYFDSDSAQVESALATIGELRGELFAAAAPDISGSLRLLRQYRNRSEGTQ